MTQYMLLIYSDRSALAQMSEEDQAADMKRWFDYSDWLAQKGWIRAGDALHGTEQATSVRVEKGERLVTDGPFADANVPSRASSTSTERATVRRGGASLRVTTC